MVLLGLVVCDTAVAGYSVEPANHYRKAPRFDVRFAGAGDWRTVYHSEPPNQGGDNDTNDAHDRSTQSWDLAFRHRLRVPQCRPALSQNPCEQLTGLEDARGETIIDARVRHTHVDGLYSELNMAEHCRIHQRRGNAREPAAVLLDAVSEPGELTLATQDPVSDSLIKFPAACPGHDDSLDGLLDNYYTPGFSFADGWGPERWFTSRRVTIPLRVLHRAKRVDVRVADRPGGTPPADCAVHDPSTERCSTGGAWSGVLSLVLVR
jgi:hypothetical protein